MELLRQLHDSKPGLRFIMLTGQGTIEEAVEATKLGAYNFLEKPVDPKRLQVELRNCLERQESERQLEVAHRRLRDMGVLGSLVGRSAQMQEVMRLIGMVAPFQRVRLDHRRKRHGEGVGGAHPARAQSPPRQPFCGRQLRGDPRVVDGK